MSIKHEIVMRIKIILLILILLVFGMFAFNYIQSDGMRLLPVGFNTSLCTTRIIVVLFMAGLLCVEVLGIYKMVKTKRFTPAVRVLLILFCIALFIYLSVSYWKSFFV